MVETATHQNTKKNNPENILQPVYYGVLPEQSGNEIDIGELFFRIISQWKLITAITAVGGLFTLVYILNTPSIYQPSVTVSLPSSGSIAPIIEMNTQLGQNSITETTRAKLTEEFSESQIATLEMLFGGNNALPATPQEVFKEYFRLLRSNINIETYLKDHNYMSKLYPDSEKPVTVLFADFLKGYNVEILEPKPETNSGYVEFPGRVAISLMTKEEAQAVKMLNGYTDYINQKVIKTFKSDAKNILEGRVVSLEKQVETQRNKYRKQRLLTIQKIEQENAKKIAQLNGQISAALKKAGLSRETRIANAKEALKMAKILEVENPSTMDILAKKGLKSKAAGTSITVVDKQSIPLYLYGTKYLNTLIETLNKRDGDEVYLDKVNEFKEKIHIIENDPVLASLKNRKSDDPWIPGLAEKLAKIEAIKDIQPDFEKVKSYSLDSPAHITERPIKPNRKLTIALGLVFSMFAGVFMALILGAKNVNK